MAKQSKRALQLRAAEIIEHDIEDSGDNISAVAGELAECRVYGCKPMNNRDLKKIVKEYEDEL